MNEQSYKKIQKQDKETFIFNLVYLREQNNLTQDQMHRKIGYGLKLKTFQSWEERRAFPPIFFCRIISILFQKDLNELLTKKMIEQEH
jgi:DNA-binding XRE family transcriptional regulator